MTGPNSLVKAFLPRVTHFSRPCAVTVASRGLSFKRASSIYIYIYIEEELGPGGLMQGQVFLPPK